MIALFKPRPANDEPGGPDWKAARDRVEDSERDELLTLFDDLASTEASAIAHGHKMVEALEKHATLQDRIALLVSERTGRHIDATPNPITPAAIIARVTESEP